MTRVHDNPFPRVITEEVSAASVPTPPAGERTYFTDSSDHLLKAKNSAGAVTTIGSSSIVQDWKESVRVATTANITLSGTQTIDGVSVIANDRVLVKDQSTASQNGIYVCAAGAWSRATDADADSEVTANMAVAVEEGTANGDKIFILTTNNPITVGTTALTFTALSTGGATSIKTRWFPDAPPASPTSQDDEFDDGSLDAKWTEFDPNNVLTPTESSTYKLLQLTQATRAGTNLVGVYQTLPAGDFTIWTKVSFLGYRQNYQACGLCFWENPSDTTKSLLTHHLLFTATGINWETGKWNNHNNFNSQGFSLGVNHISSVYLRTRRNSTNYYHAISYDGLGWFEFGSAVNPLVAPTKMGVFSDNENIGVNVVSLYGFFRYKASDVGAVGILDGRAVPIYS